MTPMTNDHDDFWRTPGQDSVTTHRMYLGRKGETKKAVMIR
jgi:hypothetical protein